LKVDLSTELSPKLKEKNSNVEKFVLKEHLSACMINRIWNIREDLARFHTNQSRINGDTDHSLKTSQNGKFLLTPSVLTSAVKLWISPNNVLSLDESSPCLYFSVEKLKGTAN
jgi:hypothetical protein